MVSSAGLEADEAGVASWVFAFKKFEVTSVEALRKLKLGDFEKVFAAAEENGLSLRAKNAVHARWEALQAAALLSRRSRWRRFCGK